MVGRGAALCDLSFKGIKIKPWVKTWVWLAMISGDGGWRGGFVQSPRNTMIMRRGGEGPWIA